MYESESLIFVAVVAWECGLGVAGGAGVRACEDVYESESYACSLAALDCGLGAAGGSGARITDAMCALDDPGCTCMFDLFVCDCDASALGGVCACATECPCDALA